MMKLHRSKHPSGPCEKLYRKGRPKCSLEEAVKWCLERLFATGSHWDPDDEIAPMLSYEEVVGALLLAEDTVKELHEHEKLEERAKQLDYYDVDMLLREKEEEKSRGETLLPY